MDGLKETIGSVCAISALICIIDGITSGTRLKNQMKFLLNLLFILVAVTPLLKGAADIELPKLSDFSISEVSASDSSYRAELERQTAENISSVLARQLEAAGIRFDKIETNVNISETNSISISSVTVAADDFDEAARIIRSSLGEDMEVLNDVS